LKGFDEVDDVNNGRECFSSTHVKLSEEKKLKKRVDQLETFCASMTPKLFYQDNDFDVLTLPGKNANQFAIELAKYIHGTHFKDMVFTANGKKSRNSTRKLWSIDEINFFKKAVKMRAKLSDKKFDDRFDSFRNSVNDAASYERKLFKNSENAKNATQTGSQNKDDSAFLNKSKKFNFEQAKVLFNRKKEDEDEIDLWQGEVITILSKNDENVWIGLKEDKQKGFFPSEFVQIINPMNPNNESNPQAE
jgi:hypothetical protein